ncbi:MAG TPA: SsrA-binding protein SmpB [Candidatus Paceibacterota bacterium]|nr:SsrA-binding protein SmpB [Candidatus Paceibacterota bacterium]
MILVENKKVRLRYEILDTLTAGIELAGAEAKSLRQKHGSLDGSRVVIRGGEAYLVGASIPPYQVANTPPDYDPARTRRLLLSKKEIVELSDIESRKGLTIVPIEVYNAKRFIKVKIAVVRGKGKADKREDLKLRDAKREMERALRKR